MKILLVAPVHKEKEFLQQEEKLSFLKGQGQQSWVEALENLGHEVKVFRYTDSLYIPNILRIYFLEFIQSNFPHLLGKYRKFKDKFYMVFLDTYLKSQKLLKMSKTFRPEVILISGGVACFYPNLIKDVKKDLNCKIFLFSGINPKIASTCVERIIVKNGVIDLVVENDRGYAKLWKKLGAKKVLVLPVSSVDSKIHRKIKLTEKEIEYFESDVSFVGSLTKERQNILKQACTERIRSVQHDIRNINLKIWGDVPLGERLLTELKPFYLGKAYGEKMVKIFNASKIVLNFQPADMETGGNMRTFEVCGCGAFQLVDRVENDWFEDGKDLVIFKNIADLKRKIIYYLKSEEERLEISKKGYEKAHRLHTYQKHFSKLFKYCNL